LVSADQWALYAKQAVSPAAFKLTLRQRLHPGDPIAYTLESSSNDRIGRTARLYKVARINGLSIDGTEMMTQPGNGAIAVNLMPSGSGTGAGVVTATGSRAVTASGISGGFGGTTVTLASSRTNASVRGTLEIDSAKMQQLSAGMHAGELRLEVKVTPTLPTLSSVSRSITIPANADNTTFQKLMRDRQTQMQKEMFRAADPVLADVEVKMPVKLEMLGVDEPTVRRIDDEKLRREVEDSITINRVRVLATRAYVQITCTNPPTDLAYAVFLRQGEKEWPAGTVAFRHGSPIRSSGSPGTDSGFIAPGEEPTGTSVDVVLKPDPAAALANPEIESYWGGEIVIKDVPLDQAGRIGMAQMPPMTFADPLNTLSLGRSSPAVVVMPPGLTARGLLLKFEIRRSGNGKAAAASTAPTAADAGDEDDSPKLSRELLVYPNMPFLQRWTENGTTATLSGTVRPGTGATLFNVDLEYWTTSSNGPAPRGTGSSRSNVPLDRPLRIGSPSGDETKWITLSFPPTTQK
jgi:hypothetical protein